MKNQISAKILLDSVNESDDRLTTFELEYPRFIHSELMTHRMFSRNSASSRAIPAKKLRKQVWSNPAMPLAFGRNKPGMQSTSNLGSIGSWIASRLWRGAAKFSCLIHAGLGAIGVHKQFVNRILEPWVLMRVVLSMTESCNYYWLRLHKDAQPEIKKLAEEMYAAHMDSIPVQLSQRDIGGEPCWHAPYVGYVITSTVNLDLKTSTAATARVSFLLGPPIPTVAERVFSKLVDGERFHASPFEHPARPITDEDIKQFHDGKGPITHMDAKGDYWCGNFKGWVQLRHVIESAQRECQAWEAA